MNQTSTRTISAEKPRSKSLSYEYGQFLSNCGHWRWFFTGTYRCSRPGVIAKLDFDDFIRRWHHETAVQQAGSYFNVKGRLCGHAIRRWRRGSRVPYVLTVEPHKERSSGHHVHAVLANPLTFDLCPTIGNKLWNKRHGFCQIKTLRETTGASAICYANKYMWKDGDVYLSDELTNKTEDAPL